jgi:hypothetical protein
MKNTHIFKEKAEVYSQKIGLEIKGSVIKILKNRFCQVSFWFLIL